MFFCHWICKYELYFWSKTDMKFHEKAINLYSNQPSLLFQYLYFSILKRDVECTYKSLRSELVVFHWFALCCRFSFSSNAGGTQLQFRENTRLEQTQIKQLKQMQKVLIENFMAMKNSSPCQTIIEVLLCSLQRATIPGCFVFKLI